MYGKALQRLIGLPIKKKDKKSAHFDMGLFRKSVKIFPLNGRCTKFKAVAICTAQNKPCL